MEQSNGILGMLDLMVRPAFAVKDGKITYVNPEAVGCMLTTDMSVAELLENGTEEYAALEHGTLYLTLRMCDHCFGACVTRVDGFDIFVLEQQENQPELQAVALAAREIRKPLSDILIATQRLLPELDTQDPAVQKQAELLSNNLYKMLRLVSNMSDADRYTSKNTRTQELRDITAVIGEIFEKCAALAERADIRIQFTNLPSGIICLTDTEKLERAIYNIISNAMKFTAPGGQIDAKLSQQGNRLLLNIRDNGSGIPDDILSSIFSRHLRAPGIEEGRQGIGLGMVLVRSAAAAHGGTVLIQRLPDGGTSITMTLAIRKRRDGNVSSPVLRMDYGSGFDHGLIELADVLPPELYSFSNTDK